MEFALDFLAITALFAAFIRSKKGAISGAVFIILFIYVINMRIQSAEFYPDILDTFGYYVSQSFFELMVAVLLLIFPSKEAILIIGLCLLSVFVNISGFGAEYLGFNPKPVVDASIWVLFGLQLLILFSQGITNALFRGAASFGVVRTYCSHHREIDTKGLS